MNKNEILTQAKKTPQLNHSLHHKGKLSNVATFDRSALMLTATEICLHVI